MALELLSLKSRLQLCVDGNRSTSLWLYCVSGVFIADFITRLHGSCQSSSVVLSWKRGGSSTWLSWSESLQLQSSCALVGVGVAHLSQYVELRAPLWLVTGGAAIAIAHVSTVERAFWGESLALHFVILLHIDIFPLTIISIVPVCLKSWVQRHPLGSAQD